MVRWLIALNSDFNYPIVKKVVKKILSYDDQTMLSLKLTLGEFSNFKKKQKKTFKEKSYLKKIYFYKNYF